MNKTLIIIQREFVNRVSKKSFILLTVLTPFIFAALIFVPIWLASIKDDGQKTVIVVDKTNRYVSHFKDAPGYRFVADTEIRPGFRSDTTDIEAVISITHEDRKSTV